MRAGKVVALVAGILIVLFALALLAPGGVLLGIYGTQRDSDGFFQTSSRVLSTNGSALVTPDVELNMGPLAGRWIPTGHRAAIRIEATATGGEQLFVGIGPSRDVAQYLEGVDYDEVTDFGWAWSSVKYRHMDGSAMATPPGEEDFWVAEQEGPGTLTLDWDIVDGNWTVVVMNADASAPVRAEISLGARFDILLWIGIGITVGGVILLAVGILLIVLGARKSSPPPAPTTPVEASQTTTLQTPTAQAPSSSETPPQATTPQATGVEQPGSQPPEAPSSGS